MRTATEAFLVGAFNRDHDPVVMALQAEGPSSDGTVIETVKNDAGFTTGWVWHVPAAVVARVRSELSEV